METSWPSGRDSSEPIGLVVLDRKLSCLLNTRPDSRCRQRSSNRVKGGRWDSLRHSSKPQTALPGSRRILRHPRNPLPGNTERNCLDDWDRIRHHLPTGTVGTLRELDSPQLKRVAPSSLSEANSRRYLPTQL